MDDQDNYWQVFKHLMGDASARVDSDFMEAIKANRTTPAVPPLTEDPLVLLQNWSREIAERRAARPQVTAIICHAECPPKWCAPLYRTDGTVHIYIGWQIYNAVLMHAPRRDTELPIPVLELDALATFAVPLVRQGFDL